MYKISFKEWLKRRKLTELVGTSAIYTGEKCGPDCQWWGAPETAGPKKNKTKGKKKVRGG